MTTIGNISPNGYSRSKWLLALVFVVMFVVALVVVYELSLGDVEA